MVVELGQKECMSEVSKSSKGIKEWTGSVTASQQGRNGGADLSQEEEMAKGRYFLPASVLIAGGEREGAVLVPHVGDSWPTARRSGRTEVRIGAPIFGR
jgi:hypothetical protein